MLRSITAMIGQIIDAAGSVVGYRHGTEEPAHSTQKLTSDVEIRRYGARVAAETTVVADEESARNVGFRRLARYIFGVNHGQEKVSMTAPVSQEAVGDGEWVIRFFMPADKTLDSLPKPYEAEIRLVTVPPATIAVHRFSGNISRRTVASKRAHLMNTLGDLGFEALDASAAWFYDPPWTVPALRRNEIAVAVKPRPQG